MATPAEELTEAVRLHQQGERAQAERLYRQILQVDPQNLVALHLLGVIAYQAGKQDAAIDLIGRALRLKPDYAEAHSNLGNALKAQGHLSEAIASYETALRIQPDYADAHSNLGNALLMQGRLDEAVARYQHALRLRPNYAVAHYNLGVSLQELGRLDEAVATIQDALRLNPDYAQAYNNLGNALKDQGRLDAAIASYRRAVQLQPDYVGAHSNLVYTLCFCPDFDAATIYAEHRHWSRQHAEPLAKFLEPHDNDRSPGRRLRIGYLAPDFRWHPVGRFLLPLLENHDHDRFEVYCYAALNTQDFITDRCQARADGWRPVFGLTDDHVANFIRRDRIDILVDLAMHTANNRLPVFARKPAPVQVTYLAYCGTTGLDAIDYRLTDPYLDPPGHDERFYSEKSVRLPETYWCYQPIIQTPEVSPLPALQNGYVTFGCLNNFCKVTPSTLAAWARLLQTLPQARLLLHAQPGSHRDRVSDCFARHNVNPERLAYAHRVPSADYYRLYEQVDVALDPFPYGGGTTTCDALWMGVPVISLAGQSALGRGGLSILSNIGLADLVARDAEHYARLAAELASDLPRLSALRTGMRARMQASPLMNAPRFARDVEAAYRAMWQRWCIQ